MGIDPNVAAQGGIGAALIIALIAILRDAVNRLDKRLDEQNSILREVRDEIRGGRSDSRAEAAYNAADHDRILERLEGNVTPIRGVPTSPGIYGAARHAGHRLARDGDVTPLPVPPRGPNDSPPPDDRATDPARRRR